MSKKAIDLLRIVWTAHGNDAWTAINHSMRVALNLAIGARLEWDKKAIIEVEQTMRSHYWIGEDGWEGAYALAVAVENHSFIEAYEVHTGRKPFFANNVTTRDGDGYRNRNSGCTRKRERLALGSICGGGKVTSIGADHVTVCTYERNDRTPKKREKLTREMCLERWPAKKSDRPQTERKMKLTSNLPMGLSQSDCDPKPTCSCGVPLSPLDVEANDGMCSDCREDERVRKILLQEYAN